jgi:hypothetical protein
MSQHWLDRSLPRLRVALNRAAHAAWLRSVDALLQKAAPNALPSHRQLVRDAVQQRYAAALQRHSARVPAADPVAQGHLRAACRTAATYGAVLPFARDSEALMQLLVHHAGLGAAPVLSAARVAALLFAPDPMALAARLLRNMRLDYGTHGFAYAPSAPTASDDGIPPPVVITQCLYVSILAEEGVPGLARCCCCELDTRSFFGDADKPSAVLSALRPSAAAVRVRLVSSLARGDAACCIRVARA